MKPLVVSCLVCLMFILATQIQAGPRIVFDPEQTDSTGQPVESKMISLGIGDSGSTLTEKPVRCRFFRGVIEGGTAADSVIYVFASPTAADSVLVESFLAVHSPQGLTRAKNREIEPRFASLFVLEVSVSPDRKFAFILDEKRHSRMSKIVFVDSGGNVLDRRPGLAERR